MIAARSSKKRNLLSSIVIRPINNPVLRTSPVFANAFDERHCLQGTAESVGFGSSYNAIAGTVAIKGREAGTFVTANFTYDGASNAGLASYTGDDNIGGPFSGQDLEEYSFTGGSCTAPDSSVGTVIVLVQATRTD